MVSQYLRQNVLGLIAIFIALGGTAAALPGKNTVNSGDIKNANVKNADLASNAVTSDKIADDEVTGSDVDESTLDTTFLQARVGASCSAGNSIRAIAQNGTVTCEADDAGGPPSGPAGGDLSGTYPDPDVGADAIGTNQVVNNALTGTDISEASLDTTVLQSRVSSACVAGASIRAIAQNGSVTCETDSGDTVTSAESSGYATGSSGSNPIPNSLAFIGPAATITVATGQSVYISSTPSLGAGATPAGSLTLDVCTAPVSTGFLTTHMGNVFGLTSAANSRLLYPVSGIATGLTAGNYNVGLCGLTPDANWTNNGFVGNSALVFGP